MQQIPEHSFMFHFHEFKALPPPIALKYIKGPPRRGKKMKYANAFFHPFICPSPSLTDEYSAAY